MRKLLAVVAILVMAVAVVLYAIDTWEGITLRAHCGKHGGYGEITYPALAADESIVLEVWVYYEGAYPTDYVTETVTGPCAAGDLILGEANLDAWADVVYTEATCVRYGQTHVLIDSDTY